MTPRIDAADAAIDAGTPNHVSLTTGDIDLLVKYDIVDLTEITTLAGSQYLYKNTPVLIL